MRCGLAAGLLALALAGCQPAPAPPPPALRAQFRLLLHRGDSVYAQKAGFGTFARALAYYDRAQTLADGSQDTLLLAEAAFAKGRIYDAWNKQPQQTIRYYQRAADLLRYQPGQRGRYYHLRHLVAHAYDKVPDSLHTVLALRQLGRELRPLPDSVRRGFGFIPELALIATQVRNYPLADTLLGTLTRRAWVRNNPATYNYLDHYYLSQARLDIYHRHRPASPYLDSLGQVLARAANPLDRQYYTNTLSALYADAGRFGPAYALLRRNRAINDSLDSKGGDFNDLRRTLVQSETQQRRAEARALDNRNRAIGALSAGLAIISLLSFYLFRQARRGVAQSVRLAGLNQQLDEQVAQVALLNKEIQHRVKNNLHMVFSLLQMQERRTANPEVVAQLQAARLRVEGIAALHNQLADPATGLDLGAYLKTIVSAAVGCLATDQQVVTHLVVQALHLPPNRSLALALVVNEWVTNSVKYAHPAGGPLEISVHMHPHPTGVQLEYFDNGPAPAATPGPAATPASGLGTQIVGLLCRQLGATLATRPHQPYHYELHIPLDSV